MNKKRLMKLAGLLEADANNPKGVKFDLGLWAERPRAKRFPKEVKRLDCNTSACAVGLACLSGAFKEEGLSWESCDSENNITPMFNGHTEYAAVEQFFGITNHQADYLFTYNSYAPDLRSGREGELAVAARIREMVKA